MRVRQSLLALTTLIALGLAGIAAAGPYDFDYKGVNDMRKAYRICKLSNYQDGDCPKVWRKCQQPPLLDWDGDSKCRKPPHMTDKNEDAKKALRDGNSMRDGTDPAPDYSQQAEDEAFVLDEGADANADSCAMAADRAACDQALAYDTAGVDAYQETMGPIADDPEAAAAAAARAGQLTVVDRIEDYIAYSNGTQSVRETDLVEDNSYLDDAEYLERYADFEEAYGIPVLEPAPAP